MTNRTILGGLGVLLVLIVGGVVYQQKQAGSAVPEVTESAQTATTTAGTVPATATTPPSASTPGPTGITSAVVATHNSRTSCWSIINGSVYDLTSWIPKHPGGEEAILRLCGTDGSERFNRKHGGAVQQATILAGFKVGVVAP